MLDLSTFAYHREAPQAFSVLAEQVRDGARIQDISFKSPLSGQVSAYLILPLTARPQAGLIFGHWGEGNRAEFVDESVILTHLGIASVCLDSSFCRPQDYEPEETLPEADLQWILDVRRTVDLLQDHYALTPEHLGYVGHSFGATFGGVVAGVEHRLTAYVLMAGTARATEMMRTSKHPQIVRARERMQPDAWEAMLTAEAPYDAYHYIGQAAPAALLFQFARHDAFVPSEEAEYYFACASQPKSMAWYEDCGHEMSGQARIDRAIFLCAQLGLPAPSQAVCDLLGRVASPVPISH